MLTPVDLETTVFRRSFRGYSAREVQDFMEQLTRDYEHLYRENIELKEKVEELTAKVNQYKNIEETLRNTMILAQETAEEVKSAAHVQAEMIIREAKLQEEQVKVKIKEEIQGELRTLALLKNQTEYFKCQFKSFLTGLLELADKQLDLEIDWNWSPKESGNLSKADQDTAREENVLSGLNEAAASSVDRKPY
ncbi:MAG: DivIVA domain-containing protein [Firmicutes bacterium]|nr:DivIVA domain-containing protein [Bacillota bacterium]